LNCGAPLTHLYCAACGQHRVDLAAPTWHLLRDALSDATDLDGRILRTVRALASPGKLTIDFLRGRREPYIGPAKLFLTAGAALSTTWLLTRSVDGRYYGYNAGGSAAAYINSFVRGLFAASFAIAITGWALARGRRRLFDEVVFALHIVATVALWIAVVIWAATGWKVAWGTVTRVPSSVPSLIYLLFLPAAAAALAYTGVALRRVFGGPWWAATLRTLLIAIIGLGAIWLAIAVRVG
jgi:hypothetical protein